MVSYSYYESDSRVRRYAEALSDKGFSVDMVALQSGCYPKREILNGVAIHRIQKRTRNEKHKISYLLKILVFLIKSFLFITFEHLKKPFKLVHVHSVPDFLVFAAVVPKITGGKIILDIHDILPEFYANKFKSSLNGIMFKALIGVEKLSCCFADHVIIANHLWKNIITERSVPSYKCTAIINYPDDKWFFKRQDKKKSDKCVILYPGSLNYHQGVDLAINAFSKIISRFPRWEFHIYGYGPERMNLEKMVSDMALNEKILFKKTVQVPEIAEQMAKADLSVIPKRADLFGDKAFSTKSFEFLALGVPVIISRTTIDQFYFNDQIVAFFKPDDVSDLAHKMEILMGDYQLRKKYADQGLVFAENNRWSSKKVIYLDVINNLMKTS